MSASKSAGSHLTLQIVAGLVAWYFFCPVLLFWPFFALYGPTGAKAPPRVVEVVRFSLGPVRWLCEKVPPYRTLIEAECRLLGVK